MRFVAPLIVGRLIKRYKRFFVEVRLEDGREVVAHCPNPGAMLGVLEPGNRVWLSPATNPLRQLRYTWEVVQAEGSLVGVNTQRANLLVEEALRQQKIKELASYTGIKREVRYGVQSRVDFLLTSSDEPACYLEVKNVHLKRGTQAYFPDSATKRGVKHLKELTEIVKSGGRAVVLYMVQREDVESCSVAKDLDPEYAQVALEALSAGVEMIGYACRISEEEIFVEKALSFRL